MNKEEFKAKLHNCEERLKDVANEIEKIREQLFAVAEKPKLRHGDFGYENGLGRISLKSLNGSMFSAGPGCCFDQGRGDKYHPKVIFGNIFDLLKEWSEDLEKWERPTEKHNKFMFKICGCTIDFHTNPYCSFDLAEAEEIWHKLGQMIATLKRKQSI